MIDNKNKYLLISIYKGTYNRICSPEKRFEIKQIKSGILIRPHAVTALLPCTYTEFKSFLRENIQYSNRK